MKYFEIFKKPLYFLKYSKLVEFNNRLTFKSNLIRLVKILPGENTSSVKPLFASVVSKYNIYKKRDMKIYKY